jgi:hypothetical protein
MGWRAAAVLRRGTCSDRRRRRRAVYGLRVAPRYGLRSRLGTAMMARGECFKWIVVLYRSWSTVLRNVVLMMEGSKLIVVRRSERVARGMESGGNCESGHCSIQNHGGGKTRSGGLMSWGDMRTESACSYSKRRVTGETMCHVCVARVPRRKVVSTALRYALPGG